MSERRQLKFDHWDQIRNELDALLAGYEQTGKWNLAQVCLHLKDWLSYPVDGFPVAPLPMRWLLTLLRLTIGKSQLDKILSSGSMPAGGPTMPETVHRGATSEQDVQAVADLKSTIARFQSYTGPIHSSPLFGPMDKATAERLQFVHFAHHLGFLKPKA